MRSRNTVKTTAARFAARRVGSAWPPEGPLPALYVQPPLCVIATASGLEPRDGWLGVFLVLCLSGCFVARIGGPR